MMVHAMLATAGEAIQIAENMRGRGSMLCPRTVRWNVKTKSVIQNRKANANHR
jgi:hypothetical protein